MATLKNIGRSEYTHKDDLSFTNHDASEFRMSTAPLGAVRHNPIVLGSLHTKPLSGELVGTYQALKAGVLGRSIK